MQHKCPVCNKVGLTDYRAIETMCPQCNSDLKPYLLLNSISNGNGKKKSYWDIISLGILSVILALLFFNSSSENKKQIAENKKLSVQFQDSISKLQSQLNIELLNQQSEQPEIMIEYKVRLGDYLSKIALFFYNDWKMYKKIELDNNLVQPYILKEGQKLKIKINQ
jgi:hypothetical protein